MPDPAPSGDPVAARLAEYRADSDAFGALSWTAASALLDAVEAVAKLAGEWDEAGVKLQASADRAVERGALPERTALMDGRAQAHRDDAQALREHIARALLGRTAMAEEHGTIAGYRRHLQDGEDEEPCAACAERYDRAYAVQYGRARRRAHKRLKDEHPERFAVLLAEERAAIARALLGEDGTDG